MPFFPILESENIIQQQDKIRLSAAKSFASKGEEDIVSVEIEPDTGVGYTDVTGSSSSDWYLDWAYLTPGDKTPTVKITGATLDESVSSTITCLTPAEDKLFSDDNDLVRHEFDILKWLPDGKSSYKYIHRASQDRILAYLDEKGYSDVYGDKFTKAAVIDVTEFTQWSKFMSLRLIFESLSNATDDIFHEKAKRYEAFEVEARNKVLHRMDTDGSGTVEPYEGLYMSGTVLRR